MIFDLIAQQSAAQEAVWTPAELFKNGEEGFWLDGSDYSTMFQDQAGTTPVTAVGQPIGLWKNKITGQTHNFNFSQATAAARPLTVTNSGKQAVRYDGVDDILSTIDSGTVANSGATISLGQKTGAVASGKRVFYGLSPQVVTIQNQANQTIFNQMFGLTLSTTELYSITSPNVLTLFARPNVTPITSRTNGVQTVGGIPTATAIGSFIRVVGDPLLFSDISQVVFINRVLTSEEITLLEAFIASKQ